MRDKHINLSKIQIRLDFSSLSRYNIYKEKGRENGKYNIHNNPDNQARNYLNTAYRSC